VEQEPDGNALVLVNPKENEEAGEQHPDDDRDEADRRGNELVHTVLEPCDEDTEAREEQRQDEEPKWDRVNGEREREVHVLTLRFCQFYAKAGSSLHLKNFTAGGTILGTVSEG
jgi:hypothetical protein